jgi:S1-C subfamily serine protease
VNYGGRRPTITDRLRAWGAAPLGAAILGGSIVLVAGVIAVEAGWIGEEKKTTVVEPAIGDASARQSSNDGLTVRDIYKRDNPGVVFVRAEIVQRVQSPFDLFPQSQRGEATGSGFVIDKEGDILTNAHVVQGARKIEIGFSNNKTADAKVVGRDTSNDVALLKVDISKNELHPLSLGNSSSVQVGDPVVAIGNPFGLDRTVTTGIVSARQRELRAPNGFTINDVIQTDAAINPGNSGGPLIDARGSVIGINSQIETAGGGGSIGIGFAVPINKAKQIAGQLKKSGKVEHAFLGISGISISSSLSDKLNLPTSKGVLVQQATGPAKKAGVQGGDTPVTISGQDLTLGGDVVVEIDGKKIDAMNDVINVVDSKKPGDEVTLKLLRGSKSRTVTAKLGTRPQNADLGSSGGGSSPNQLPPGSSP